MHGRFIERLVSSNGQLNLIKAYVTDGSIVPPPHEHSEEQANFSQCSMNDVELAAALDEFGHLGFDDLPVWLRYELTKRSLTWQPRNPTEQEKQETAFDEVMDNISTNKLSVRSIYYLSKGE